MQTLKIYPAIAASLGTVFTFAFVTALMPVAIFAPLVA